MTNIGVRGLRWRSGPCVLFCKVRPQNPEAEGPALTPGVDLLRFWRLSAPGHKFSDVFQRCRAHSPGLQGAGVGPLRGHSGATRRAGALRSAIGATPPVEVLCVGVMHS